MSSGRQIGFNASLYSREGLESAVSAYSELAEIELQEDKGDILAIFHRADPDFGEELFDSFCNHALFETIVLRRASRQEQA